MKKILFAALAVLTLGMFSSCVYDNPIDVGEGEKLVTSGFGGGPMPVEVTPASLFSPNLKNCVYNINPWVTDWNAADPYHPTCLAGEFSHGKLTLFDTDYCGGTVGAGGDVHVTYDLSAVKSISYSIYFPTNMAGKVSLRFGSNLGVEQNFYGETAKKGLYNMTVSEDEIGNEEDSPDLLLFGTGDHPDVKDSGKLDNHKSFYIFNITFYDEDGNEITEIPVSGLDSDDEEDDDDE